MSERTMSRRSFLAGVGAALGVAAVPVLAGAPQVAKAAPTPAPWTYTKQDPEKIARRAFEIYYQRGCAEGTWYPLIEALASDPTNPDKDLWATLPQNMFWFGGGGVNGWGTICGTCTGSAAIIKMMKKPGQAPDMPATAKIIDGALDYYANTPLPTNGADISARKGDWTPPKPLFANLPTSTAHSPLCHVSLSQWRTTSGFQEGSPQTADRCAKATYDLAYHTVVMLNAWLESDTFPATTWAAEMAACKPCHAGSVAAPVAAPQYGKMGCGSCHDETPTHAE